MKGIIFTEFLDMVEQEFGYETVDHIIEKSELLSAGVYTAIGTYEFSELSQLIMQLEQKTGTPVNALLTAYGEYLFGTFVTLYPHFFQSVDSSFSFFESIDNHIHVQVNKLYPDAELPKLSTHRLSRDTMEMIYKSKRKLGAFALGLIQKTLEYFQEKAEIQSENVAENGSIVKFTIQLQK